MKDDHDDLMIEKKIKWLRGRLNDWLNDWLPNWWNDEDEDDEDDDEDEKEKINATLISNKRENGGELTCYERKNLHKKYEYKVVKR